MGTTAEEQPEYRGVVAKADHAFEIISTRTADTAYGRRGGSLYPILLLTVLAVSLALSAGSAISLGVGLVAILLLGIWVGGGGHR